jgi:ubiquinone/menaquinone biosynthesis C-methylase UbiE
VLKFDADVTSRLERVYTTADMLRRRRLVREALAARPGERILDVGCGPGFYTKELLDEVGDGGHVTAIDASPDMLAAARKRTEGHANVDFHQGDATKLPVEDERFDGAVCVQVLEYVPDATAALAEILRALKPGGRAVVWDIDWSTLSWHTSDEARMRRALDAWDTHLTHPALPRTLAARLHEAGFEGVTVKGHAFTTTELSTDYFGGAIFPMIAQYAADDAWEAEQKELAERGEFFFSVTQFCFTARRA